MYNRKFNQQYTVKETQDFLRSVRIQRKRFRLHLRQVLHCANRDANSNTENGYEFILCVYISVFIDTMLKLNVDLDANANVSSEQDSTRTALIVNRDRRTLGNSLKSSSIFTSKSQHRTHTRRTSPVQFHSKRTWSISAQFENCTCY